MAANVHQLVQRWKKIDIPQLQSLLDETATDLTSRQDESDASRKRLVELSRDFKRTASEEVRTVAAPLLKSFQAEVDALSRRAKAAEAAFLTVYKKVIDLPDPVPILEQVCGRAARAPELEAENTRLRDSLRDLRLAAKTQDATVKQLQNKLREYEDNLETTIREQLVEQESQLRREEEDRLASLTHKLEEADKKVVHLQSALETSQSELMELKSRYDDLTQSKFEDLEMMMSDLERANQRTAVAEKELAQLKERLAEDKERFPGPQATSATANLEVELSAKEKQISHLMDDIQRLQSTLATLKETSASKISQLEELLAEKDKIIQVLEDKLHQQRDYEEIKKELSIFKAAELPHSPNSKKSFEVMLLEKNKALQSENTSLKVAKSEIARELERIQRERDQLAALSEEQKWALAQLEADLAKVGHSVALRSEGEGQEAESPLPPEIVAEAEKSAPVLRDVRDPTTSESSLLAIISSQRERFRIRIQELELEKERSRRREAALSAELAASRADNLKLYEKIRFLQSYNHDQKRPPVVSRILSDVESSYSDQYEKKLDPFAAFSRKERQRKYMNLSPFEKITYTLGQTILSNRTARTLAFFYTIFLHLLIFLVLYKLAYTEVCQKDLAADCNERWRAHMQQVHGDKI